MDGSSSSAGSDPSGGGGSSSASVGSTSGETTANDTSGPLGTSDGASTGVVVPEDCDVFAQDCPEGYKCAPYSSDGDLALDAVRCVPVDPDPVGIGEVCTAGPNNQSGIDDCDVGALCWDLDPRTGMGECIELCGGSPEEPICEQQPEATCLISSSGVVFPCVLPCDPLGDDCDDDELCVPTNDTFFCVTDGAPETGAQGEACEYLNVCDPGLACLAPAEGVCDEPLGAGCCLPFCSVATPDCPGDLSCVPWWGEGEAPAGFEDLGACHLPQ